MEIRQRPIWKPPPPAPGLGDWPRDLRRRTGLAIFHAQESRSGNACRSRRWAVRLGNDIWGWFDAASNKEYALMGMANGTAFVDISDPENPIYLGILPTQTVDSAWRDIKVYQDHAYVVADNAGAHGMQVFDLTRLRGLVAPQVFAADVVYADFENAHNLAINEDSGFAYAVGTNTCARMAAYDRHQYTGQPGVCGLPLGIRYTRHYQCVDYQGPDTDNLDSEVCFSSAEVRVAIVDVTLKPSPVTSSIRHASRDRVSFIRAG